MNTWEAQELANLGDYEAPEITNRQLTLACKVLLAFSAPLGPNPSLIRATTNFACCRAGMHPTEGADEVACGIKAAKMLHRSETRDSNNPGHWAWTIPIARMMNLHMVN